MTVLLQQLDVAVFKFLKDKYRTLSDLCPEEELRSVGNVGPANIFLALKGLEIYL